MPFRSWFYRVFAISVFTGVVFFPSLKGLFASCDCEDCTNLHNRYNQVNALLSEICAEKTDLQNLGQTDDPYNQGVYDGDLKKRWKDAMSSAKDPWATVFPSGNTDAFCRPTYNVDGNHEIGYDDRGCLLDSVTVHEAVHVATCKSMHHNRPGCTGVYRPFSIQQHGYLACMTWGEFFDDEINAYNAELNYLAAKINGLRPICQAIGRWCKTPDHGLPPSNCPSTVTPASLAWKAVEYVFGR